MTTKNNTNIENIRWDEIVDFIDGDSFYGIAMSYKYINRSKPNVHPDTIYMLNLHSITGTVVTTMLVHLVLTALEGTCQRFYSKT